MTLDEAIITSSEYENDTYANIFSGYTTLDEIKNGWCKGELSIIGGFHRMGKTSLTLNIIGNLLLEDIPVALFTATDTNNTRFISRVIAAMKKDETCLKVNIKQERLIPPDIFIPLYLNFQENLTLSYIRENARILVKHHMVKCIFIESLQSIFRSEPMGNTPEGIRWVCHELKELAYELKVPVIVTSSLSNSINFREGIEGKIPIKSDIIYSNIIEKEVDSILLLHRPSYYTIIKDEEGNVINDHIIIKIFQNEFNSTEEIKLKFHNGIIREIDSLKDDIKSFKEKLKSIGFFDWFDEDLVDKNIKQEC